MMSAGLVRHRSHDNDMHCFSVPQQSFHYLAIMKDMIKEVQRHNSGGVFLGHCGLNHRTGKIKVEIERNWCFNSAGSLCYEGGSICILAVDF